MILAAGRGERLRPVTDSTPKALVAVRGQSLIERHLVNVQRAGIRNVVINLGWLGAMIRERVGDGRSFGLDVRYSDEGENVLETGGGIHRALPMLGKQPFLVVNADIFTDMPIPEISLRDGNVGHLVLVDTPDYRREGDFDLNGGMVRNGDRPTLTFSGMAFYRPEFFANCEPGRFSIVPLMQKAADNGQLQGSYYKGSWADVPTPDRLNTINDG